MSEDHNASVRPATRGTYLITMPRTASNLFQKMMGQQKVHHAGYFFLDLALAIHSKISQGRLSEFDKTEIQEMHAMYRSAWERMMAELAIAESKVSSCFKHVVFGHGDLTANSRFPSS